MPPLILVDNDVTVRVAMGGRGAKDGQARLWSVSRLGPRVHSPPSVCLHRPSSVCRAREPAPRASPHLEHGLQLPLWTDEEEGAAQEKRGAAEGRGAEGRKVLLR